MARVNLETRIRVSRLRAESIALSKLYGEVSFDRDDASWLYVPHFPLPSGWNKREVAILVDIPWRAPDTYPSTTPQWFWTDNNLRTHDGRPLGHFFHHPHTASGHNESEERERLARGWGHFCIYMESWTPALGAADWQRGTSLITYLNMIKATFNNRNAII
ncbi:E2/UBC family protein [Rhodococcus sp. ACS1]|uniref:E2/UBC family protein n=1 Tax=Rhodococcus sp. ACS1 TaxID=2028570 RepID=UPI00117BD03F